MAFFWILLVSRNAWCHKIPRCFKVPLHYTTVNSTKHLYNLRYSRLTLPTFTSKHQLQDMLSWTFLRLHNLSQPWNIYTLDVFILRTQATLQAIPAALAKAHQVYGVKDSKVVFVMNEDGRNFADSCQVRVFWGGVDFFQKGKGWVFFLQDDLMVIVVVVLLFLWLL